MKKALYISTLAIGAFIGATALLTVSAAGTCVTPAPGWSSPTGNPPDNNVCPPINTGNVDQGKLGGLAIGAAAPTATYKLDVTGKGLFTDLGILNSLTVGGVVTIATGSPVAGQVLTAVDPTGKAAWANIPGGPGGGSGGTCTSLKALAANTDWTTVPVPLACDNGTCNIALVVSDSGGPTAISSQAIIHLSATTLGKGRIWAKVGDDKNPHWNGDGNENTIIDADGGAVLVDDKPAAGENSPSLWSIKNSNNSKTANFYVCQ